MKVQSDSTESFVLLRALFAKTAYRFLFIAQVCCFYVLKAFPCSNRYNYYRESRFLYSNLLYPYKGSRFHYSLLLYLYKESIFLYSNFLYHYKESGFLYSRFLYHYKESCFLYSLLLYYYKGRSFLYSLLLYLYKESTFLYSHLLNLYRESRNRYKKLVYAQRERLKEDIDLLYNYIHVIFNDDCRYLHHGGLVIDRGCLLSYPDKPFDYQGRLLYYHGGREKSHGNLPHRYGIPLQRHGTMYPRFDGLFRILKKLLLEIEHRIKPYSDILRDQYIRYMLLERRPIVHIFKTNYMKVKITLKQKNQSNLTAMYNAEHYISNITGNPLFQAADIVAQLARVVTANTNLHTEITAAISDNKINKINAAREALDREITDLKNKVEGIANKPETLDSERLVVVHSAGMSDKARTSHTARIFKALNGVVSGTIILLARGGARANEWQYTTDTKNFTGRIALKTTTKAMIEVPNLPINTQVAFFHKATIIGVDTDWEGPVIITVL